MFRMYFQFFNDSKVIGLKLALNNPWGMVILMIMVFGLND